MDIYSKSNEEFLKDLFRTAFEILPEIDYGSVYTYVEGEVNFIDCIGYELEAARNFSIPAPGFYNEGQEIKRGKRLKEQWV